MGLTYDGITYRSLEEQVRYDAEQVQLLKQADVTINENLQTINTEISGKLTKPTNPSAESAVTMLADGTVGTKLLSEIGGGGKLYRHITTCVQGTVSLNFITYSTNQNSYTNTEIQDLLSFKYYPCQFNTATNGSGMGTISYQIGPGFIFDAVLINKNATAILSEYHETLSFSDSSIEV